MRGKGYKTFFNSSARDFERAKAKHELAIERLCENDTVAAEQLLRDALVCDSSYGPAHNTLGKVYYDQRKFYLAAWEFEHAQKLMPERAEPSNNLGLVFEATGDYDSAIQYYETAWSQEPDNAHFLGNMLRARVRRGDQSFEMADLLRNLIKIDDRTEWVDWARGLLELKKVESVYGHYEEIFEETPVYEQQEDPGQEEAPAESGKFVPSGNGDFMPLDVEKSKGNQAVPNQ